VRAVDPGLALLANALTELVAAGEAAGLEIHQEIYADRGYTETGQLIPRSQPGAMIEARRRPPRACWKWSKRER
jgi:UPF0271 protein